VDKDISPQGNGLEESPEVCLKCGEKQGLQGVALTVGRKTFHLFYLCAKCGNIGLDELLKIIKAHGERKTAR
jgi:hypothetical protein